MKPTRDQCMKWSQECDLDWHRGYAGSSEENRYEVLCQRVWNEAITSAQAIILDSGYKGTGAPSYQFLSDKLEKLKACST